jgi:hypothetical protein
VAHHTRVLTAGLATSLVLALAAPAHAALVYVKGAGSERAAVYVARDDGTRAKRVGRGSAPAISHDGRWIAWVVEVDGGLSQVVLRRAEGGAVRMVMRSRSVSSLRFSPNSAMLGAVLGGRRVKIYDIAGDRLFTAATGHVRGWTFSPDSTAVAWGRAERSQADARGDVHVIALDGRTPQRRLTRTRDALNPLWGAQGIVFDRLRRRSDDAPVYNLWAIQPDGSGLRRITKLRIPRLASGLVPVELAGDGGRLLAAFTGQDTLVGFTVDPQSGATRALSRDFEQGLVGFDLTADGQTILGHTGGGDPSSDHDVVTIPYQRGRTRVLVRNAAYPDWSR